MKNEEILKRYQGVLLGRMENNQKLFVENINSQHKLEQIMNSLLFDKTEIYEEGINFLKEYWGLKRIVEIIFNTEDIINNKSFLSEHEYLKAYMNWTQNKDKILLKFYITPEVIKKYKDKSLVIPCYASSAQNYYSVEDFEEFNKIEYYLGEVMDGESDITITGILFFKEVFGLAELAELLYKTEWYKDEYPNAESILKWLKLWEANPSKDYSERASN